MSVIADRYASLSLVHLRHSCPCASCSEPVSRAKSFDFAQIGPDIRIQSATYEEQDVVVRWNDGHESRYPIAALSEKRSVDNRFGLIGEYPARIGAVPWVDVDASGNGISCVEFGAVVASPLGDDCRRLLRSLFAYGIVLVKNAPRRLGVVKSFLEQISLGVTFPTAFGETFQVRSERSDFNLAYSDVDLPLHTDAPYQLRAPEFQALHCIHDGRGIFRSTFADGLSAVEALRCGRRECYDVLCQTPVRWQHCHADVPLSLRRPIVEVTQGDDVRIYWNNGALHVESAALSRDHVDRLYAAMYEFCVCLSALKVSFALEPGDIALFDNRRVLHGRERVGGGHAREALGERLLEGCYASEDGLRAHYNAIVQRLGKLGDAQP